MKATLAGAEAAIGSELDRITGTLQTSRRSLAAKIDGLRARYADAQRALEDQTRAEGRLRQLQADADANRDIYNSFLLHRRELATQFNVQKSDSLILSPPSAPLSPSFPNRPLILAAATVCAAALGCALALLVDTAETGFRNLEQIERRLRVLGVGIVPSIHMGKWPGAHGASPHYRLGSGIYGIRAGLAGPNRQMPRSLLVSSAIPREGKTVTSLALARLSAACGSLTLLVDCDLARPAVHLNLGLTNAIGIADVLEGRATVQEAVVRDPVSGADVLLAGRAERHPAELLASSKMQELLDSAKCRYDVIVIDSAPLLTVADTALMVTTVDQILLVVRWRKTSQRAAAAALRVLKDANGPTCVCALTRVNVHRYFRYDSQEFRHCLGYSGRSEGHEGFWKNRASPDRRISAA